MLSRKFNLLGFFSLLTATKLMSMSLEPYKNSPLQPVGLICSHILV